MSEKTLGQIIGKVKDSFKTTTKSGEEVTITVTFDFSFCSDNDIKSWLVGNRRISMQRPLRELSANEINKLDGTTIMAHEAGKKVESREEKVAKLVAAGLPAELAGFAVDNPTKFAEIVGKVSTDQTEEES